MGFSGIAFKASDGSSIDLAALSGHPVLVVNTASKCEFTPQYSQLQELHRDYAERGLRVIAVPSNDFGAQEPGTDREIEEFCKQNFGITFPLAAKSHVIGPDAHPFFRTVMRDYGEMATPRWNFHKYLIGKDGELIAAWPSPVQPKDEHIISAIEEELGPEAAPTVQ
jgi:glutathione peroxidase